MKNDGEDQRTFNHFSLAPMPCVAWMVVPSLSSTQRRNFPSCVTPTTPTPFWIITLGSSTAIILIHCTKRRQVNARLGHFFGIPFFLCVSRCQIEYNYAMRFLDHLFPLHPSGNHFVRARFSPLLFRMIVCNLILPEMFSIACSTTVNLIPILLSRIEASNSPGPPPQITTAGRCRSLDVVWMPSSASLTTPGGLVSMLVPYNRLCYYSKKVSWMLT